MKTCQYCNKEFSGGAIGNHKRHEKTCYLNPLNKKECPVCGEVMKNYKAATCGYACSNTYFRSGINNPNFNPDNYRTICFHYHKKECVVCKENRVLAVHHADEDKTNNDWKNLIPLCPNCHQLFHSRFRMDVKPQIDEYLRSVG